MGTVFKLDPTSEVLTTLHAFTGADGANPQAGLVFDTTGARRARVRHGVQARSVKSGRSSSSKEQPLS
jgi:hypothetical protein